jgi:glycerol-3-phosphate dehydrogenase subunit B
MGTADMAVRGLGDWTPQVLVVGGGAAGTLAAVAAARAGKRVLVVRRGDGATAMSSGAVDAAEHHGGRRAGHSRGPLEPGAPWQEAAQALADAHPFHPYARVRDAVAQLPAALALLTQVAAEADLQGRRDGLNRVVATAAGTVKRAALVQGSMVGADLLGGAEKERVAVVTWPQSLHGDGGHVALLLGHSVGKDSGGRWSFQPHAVQGVLGEMDALRAPREQARMMDTPDGQQRLVDALRFALREAGPVTRVLLPPIVGLTQTRELHARLTRELGIPVGELLSPHPSVPGERLQRALEAGLVREGIRATEGRVTGFESRGRRVISVRVERGPGEAEVVPLDALVLCSGRFLAGGLSRDGGFREPLLGLPLFLDGKPVEDGFVGHHVGELPQSAQAFMRVGVLTNGALQPLNADGNLVWDNVRAAGSVLAGYDPARQQGGLGVASVTGMLAGAAAAG